jgi:hypothetical protein
MRIWIVQAGEAHEGLEVAYAGAQGMVFADTAEGYGKAHEAFKSVVEDRLANLEVSYSFGAFGTDARADITAEGRMPCSYAVADCDCEPTDIVRLTAFEVIGA